MALANKAMQDMMSERLKAMLAQHEVAKHDALNTDIDVRLLLVWQEDWVWGCTCPARDNEMRMHADQCMVRPVFASVVRDFGPIQDITEAWMGQWTMGPNFFDKWDEVKEWIQEAIQ